MSTEILDKPLTYEEERGKPMPSFNHGAIQTNLIIEFARQGDFRVLSELELELGGQRYTPDLSIYPREALDLRHDVVRRTDPPLTTVEILSATQGTLGVMEKAEAYLRNGVKSCWIIAPPFHTVTILSAEGQEEVYHSGFAKDPVTGLTANLAAVFS